MAKTTAHQTTDSEWTSLGKGPLLIELETNDGGVIIAAGDETPAEADPGHLMLGACYRSFMTLLPLYARGIPDHGGSVIVTPLAILAGGGGSGGGAVTADGAVLPVSAT